ncbi:Hermansky-Pudlak syndrome 1 protein [Contarinia nasturtii]|uniref:Hermansky-Pudlak syndrome 1 protein n=1 Tax=Contarinia nasturtii TaxID=265458 RepID=UPI0012D3D771|nr:Hermansky-Pudlak syndrome 1 protein [Contarinia nasturtii]
MDGLFVFDQQNDIIFTQLNDEINRKLYELAKKQELIPNDVIESGEIDTNVVVQLFSPIIASQRIMFCQFDNSYTSIQLEDNLNFVFEEFLGFLFVSIATESVDYQQRYVGICIAFIKHLCGPDIYLLKTMPVKATTLGKLLENWKYLYRNDESVLIEGVENLLINLDLKRVAQKALETASENLKRDPYSQRSHSILFVKNKLLSMCSSRSAQELSTGDLIFLQIYCRKSVSIDETQVDSERKVDTHLVFLQGNVNGSHAGCIPHILHICHMENDVTLIILLEYGSLTVSSGLFDVFFAVHKIRILQMQNDMDNLRPAYENLDHYIKQSLDAIKKAKYNNADIEGAVKKYSSKWELLRKKYLELFKNSDRDLILAIESNIPSLVEALKDLFRMICIECNTLLYGVQRVAEIATKIEEKLVEISEFLRVKALQNIVLGSVFKDINGLVHFIHINRSTGRIVVPIIDPDNKRAPLIQKQVWNMVKMSRSYLQKGHLSLIWQDDVFFYSYFLWFEDTHGTQLKPKEIPSSTSANAIKPHVVPGVISGEFYQWLIETCFPKNNGKIKCYELYSMYVGLTSAHTLLDFNRRLVAILRDNLTGFNGFDG